MREATRIVFIIFASLSGSIAKFYTALEIDNHPCQPQNLKVNTGLIVSMGASVVVKMSCY